MCKLVVKQLFTKETQRTHREAFAFALGVLNQLGVLGG